MAGDNYFGTTGVRDALHDDLATLHTLAGADLQGQQTREHQAKANLLELEAKQNQEFMRLNAMGSGLPANTPVSVASTPQTPQKPPSMADGYDDLARNARTAGLISKAQELSKTASLIRTREAAAEQHQAARDKDAIISARDRARLVGQLFGGVTDQASLDRANVLFQFQNGMQSPFANVPYSKELVQQITDQAISAEKRADLQRHALAQTNLDKFRDARVKQHDLDRAISERRAKLAEEREARLAKSGGGAGVSTPSNSEVTMVDDILSRDYPSLEAIDRKELAFSIAGEARGMRRANRALDSSSAIQQAINNAVLAGDIVKTPPTMVNLGITELPVGGGKGQINKGHRPERPIPISASMKASDLQKGKWYIGPKGVGQWTGTGFKDSDKGAAPASRGGGRGVDLSKVILDDDDELETGDEE